MIEFFVSIGLNKLVIYYMVRGICFGGFLFYIVIFMVIIFMVFFFVDWFGMN